MATETIFLSLEAGTNDLILTDNQGHSGKNITTDVDRGDTVMWKITGGSGISEITDIYCKAGSPNVFSSDPAPHGGGGNWGGVVSGTANGTEQYGIKYKAGGTEYDVDPFIKIKNGDGD